MQKHLQTNTYLYHIKIVQSGIILCWLVWTLFYSLTAAINIPTLHLDGAYQTASGLYRLSADQLPGRDFYPYLGIGPLFVLYPLFKISGGNISASVFSSQLLVLVFGIITVSIIWHLIWRPKFFSSSITIGSLLILLPLALTEHFSLELPDWIKYQISPGNSLRPIRAFAPYLLGSFYYFVILFINSARIKYLFSGILMGSVLLWSNDFAFTTAGLFAILILINSMYCQEIQFRNAFYFLAISVFSWIALLALSTNGHLTELLQYNFLDVAEDQWWFFGPYSESTRVMGFKQINLLFSKV